MTAYSTHYYLYYLYSPESFLSAFTSLEMLTPVLVLLVFILLIVIVLVNKKYVRLDSQESIESIEDWFEQTLPLTAPPEDYLNSKFAYRYGDSFIYHGASHLYQVYPLCCEKCTRNAHLQLTKRHTWLHERKDSLLATMISQARYPTPPREQGQATDSTLYVVLTLTRLVPYPSLRDLTRTDVGEFMKSIAGRSAWKLSDISIANTGRDPESRKLSLQFLDEVSVASSRPKNLFYNRYNILKHIPESSFISPEEYRTYPAMLKLIEKSSDHIRDLDLFLNTLAGNENK